MDNIKKIAVINDLSGIGRCSLTAAIPIISCLGVQACPFPTAILSNQTNYDTYLFKDFTNYMKEYNSKIQALNITFDGIYSGFLGSIEQIDIVIDFIHTNNNSIIIVDPVMGDNGKKYDTYTENMCFKMRDLVKVADIVTPNLTEACILLGLELNKVYNDFEIRKMIKSISNLGPSKVLITGVIVGDKIINYIYDRTKDTISTIESCYNGKYYSGTGDIISSIIAATAIKKIDFTESVHIAIDFINTAIKFTSNFDINTNEGVMFEAVLGRLINNEFK